MNSGKVWSRFTSVKKDGTVLRLRVEDVPKERQQEIIGFLAKYFMVEENLQKSAGIAKSKEARDEMIMLYNEILTRNPNLHSVMCCLDDDSAASEIVAVSSMQLTTKDEEKKDFSFLQTKEVQKMFEILNYINSFYDPIKKHNLDKYYHGKGVVVHPDYRGYGIATEIVKNRRQICKEHGVPLTGAWMTSMGTQKAAVKTGWKTVFEISFDELGRRYDVTFEDAPPLCKLMVAQPTD